MNTIETVQRIQPAARFGRLYARIFLQGARDNWAQVLAIGVLDLLSVLMTMTTMAVVVIAVTGANREDLLPLANSILGRVSFEIGDQRAAQIALVTLGGILSSAMIFASAFARYLAAKKSRRLARSYHKRLYDEVFVLFDGLETLPDVEGLERGTDLNIPIIQDSIHASKAFEALVRMPQVSLFATALLLGALKIAFFPMLALLVVCLLAAPIVIVASRRIQSAANDFFETSSRTFGGEVALILNAQETYASSFPQKESVFPASYLDAEDIYLNNFDVVQLSTDRINLSASVVRALGFGTAFASISIFALMSEANLTLIIAFATAVYLFVNQLQNLFGTYSSLVVFYPQVRRLISVLQLLSNAQYAEPLPTNVPRMDSYDLRSKPELSIGLGQPTLVRIPQPLGRFEMHKTVSRLNSGLTRAIPSNDVVFFKSAYHELFGLRLSELDKALVANGLPKLHRIADGVGLSEAFAEWKSNFPHIEDPSLNVTTFKSGSGQMQGLFTLAVALASGERHLFLDYTYVTRFHGVARDFILCLMEDRYIWLLAHDDVTAPVADEAYKISLLSDRVSAVPVTEPLKSENGEGSNAAADDVSSVTII